MCRRPKLALLAAGENETAASKALTAALGLGLLAAMAALAYTATLPTASASGPRSIGSASLVTQVSAAKNKTSQAQGALEVTQDAASDEARPARAALKIASDAGKDTLEAKPPRKRPRTVGQRIVDPRLVAARREVSVTMYSAPWCFICDRARAFLEAREVDLTEHDVDMEPQASKQLAQINAAGSIPTFVIDGKTIVGFHPWGLEDAIDQVAQQHFCAAEEPTSKNAPAVVCERLASAR